VETLWKLERILTDLKKEEDVIENTVKMLREETAADKELESAKDVSRRLRNYEKAKMDFKNLDARKEEFGELCLEVNRRILQRDLKGMVEKGLLLEPGSSPTDPTKRYRLSEGKL